MVGLIQYLEHNKQLKNFHFRECFIFFFPKRPHEQNVASTKMIPFMHGKVEQRDIFSLTICTIGISIAEFSHNYGSYL